MAQHLAKECQKPLPETHCLSVFKPMKHNSLLLSGLLPLFLLPSAHLPTVPPGSILINEILSNPNPDGVDFIELYNYCDTTIDLRTLAIASVNANGVSGKPRKITEQAIFIRPKEYKVLTINLYILQQQYPNSAYETFVETPTLPNFNSKTGGVVLYSDDIVIDSLFYTPQRQSPFVAESKGFSLERQYLAIPTNAQGNFHSAASVIGGATPGYKNSQSPSTAEQHGFSLTSRTFSPDNDGFEDELEITYALPQSGFMAKIDIYNANGYLVKKLCRNQSLATQGRIGWNGLSDANQRPPLGLYVAVIEIYHPTGTTKIYRLSFVLAARL